MKWNRKWIRKKKNVTSIVRIIWWHLIVHFIYSTLFLLLLFSPFSLLFLSSCFPLLAADSLAFSLWPCRDSIARFLHGADS